MPVVLALVAIGGPRRRLHLAGRAGRYGPAGDAGAAQGGARHRPTRGTRHARTAHQPRQHRCADRAHALTLVIAHRGPAGDRTGDALALETTNLTPHNRPRNTLALEAADGGAARYRALDVVVLESGDRRPPRYGTKGSGAAEGGVGANVTREVRRRWVGEAGSGAHETEVGTETVRFEARRGDGGSTDDGALRILSEGAVVGREGAGRWGIGAHGLVGHGRSRHDGALSGHDAALRNSLQRGHHFLALALSLVRVIRGASRYRALTGGLRGALGLARGSGRRRTLVPGLALILIPSLYRRGQIVPLHSRLHFHYQLWAYY